MGSYNVDRRTDTGWSNLFTTSGSTTAVVDYIASDPRQVVTLTPSSTASVAQAIIRSPDTGEYYLTQVHPESNGTESTRISRMASDGTFLDQMLCNYAGHGTSLALEYSGGQVYCWLTWLKATDQTTDANDVVRFPYTANDPSTGVARSAVTGLTVKIPGAGSYRNVEFDWSAGWALVRTSSGTSDVYRRHALADILAGDISSPQATVTLTQTTSFGTDGKQTVQGFATYGDALFRYTGAPSTQAGGDPFLLTEYSWLTGSTPVRAVDCSTLTLQADGTYPGGKSEPEGLSVYDAAPVGSAPRLYLGVTTGPSPGGPHDYPTFRVDLTALNGSSSGGGGGSGTAFVLGTTKPTATTVGANVLRPVTNTITPSGGVLVVTTAGATYKDTTINGRVSVRAPNVVFENCIITGPPSFLGDATTTSATYFVVEANNAACASGPAVFRYCDITNYTKTPILNGCGNRNITLDRCDISHVVDGIDPAGTSTDSNARVKVLGCYIHDFMFYAGAGAGHSNTPLTSAGGQTIVGPSFALNVGWTHCDAIQVEPDTVNGVTVDGCNIVATWSTDNRVSMLPLPYDSTGATVIKELSCFMLNGGRSLTIQRNWLDGGEECINNADANVTGTIQQNRFGRQMAHTSSSDSSYFAMMLAAAGLDSHDSDASLHNTWLDTGATVFRRAN